MPMKRPSRDLHAVRLTIRGRSLGTSYLSFAAERAHRFSLNGWAALSNPDEVTIVACGPAALIDMLEVACMLGPIEALVHEIERVELPPSCLDSAGFTIVR